MKPIQARAARYGLRLTAKDVAAVAGVSDFTVKRFEGGSPALQNTVEALREFYKSRGVRFIEDDPAVGVMFNEPDKPVSLAKAKAAK